MRSAPNYMADSAYRNIGWSLGVDAPEARDRAMAIIDDGIDTAAMRRLGMDERSLVKRARALAASCDRLASDRAAQIASEVVSLRVERPRADGHVAYDPFYIEVSTRPADDFRTLDAAAIIDEDVPEDDQREQCSESVAEDVLHRRNEEFEHDIQDDEEKKQITGAHERRVPQHPAQPTFCDWRSSCDR